MSAINAASENKYKTIHYFYNLCNILNMSIYAKFSFAKIVFNVFIRTSCKGTNKHFLWQKHSACIYHWNDFNICSKIAIFEGLWRNKFFSCFNYEFSNRYDKFWTNSSCLMRRKVLKCATFGTLYSQGLLVCLSAALRFTEFYMVACHVKHMCLMFECARNLNYYVAHLWNTWL